MSGLNKSGFDRNIFYNEIYSIVKQIPAGRVVTYGILARLAGFPAIFQTSRSTLSHHNQPDFLPCHRVVNSQGRLAPHWPQQRQLLEQEGVIFKPNGNVDLRLSGWDILNFCSL
ncbi:MAG: MGMT family protein [Odoribacter sp.]